MTTLFIILLAVFLSAFAVGLRYLFIQYTGAFAGVLISNLIACFLLSLVLVLKNEDKLIPYFGYFFVVGVAFCGALSTFSSYIELIYLYLNNSDYKKLIAFILLNHVLGLFSFIIGLKLMAKLHV